MALWQECFINDASFSRGRGDKEPRFVMVCVRSGWMVTWWCKNGGTRFLFRSLFFYSPPTTTPYMHEHVCLRKHMNFLETSPILHISWLSLRSLRWINNTSKCLASYLGIRLSSKCYSFTSEPVAASGSFVPIMCVIVWARWPCRSLFESFQVSWVYAAIVYLHLHLSHARSLIGYH